MSSRKVSSARSGYEWRPSTAQSRKTRGTGSINDMSSSSKHEENNNNFEGSDANMPAMTELIEYSKEYLPRLVELTDNAQRELSENSEQNGREKRTKLAEMENELASKNSKIRQMEDEYKKELYKLQQKNNSLQKEIEKSKHDNTKREKTIDDSNEDYKRRLQRTVDELHRTKVELEETKNRLSKLMGDKLTDNNPNIADLSDKNRPTKLGERYRELYDNEWTDAFEKLQNLYRQDEEKIISVLLKILTKTKSFCDEESKRQMEDIQKVITQSDKVRKLPVPVTVVKYIKDCRKASSSESLKNVYKKYQTWLRTELTDQTKYVKDYVDECFEICWLMAIQDPPVVLAPLPKKGDTFSSDVYSAYTVSGTTVDFPVWPALLLHSEGPVLFKGVLQPLKRPSTAPPGVSNRGTKGYSTEHPNGEMTREAWKYEDEYSPYRSDKHHGRDDYANKQYRSYEEKDLRENYDDIHRTRGYQQTYTGTHLSRTTVQSQFPVWDVGHIHRKEQYRPTEEDAIEYYRFNHEYGEDTARRLLGSKYDKIKEYLK